VRYHNATIYVAERFKNFYIDHVPRQQNAHTDALASLTASLALPASATKKVLIYNHDLYRPKFVLEDDQMPTGDLQVKKSPETSAGPELRDWRFPYIDYGLHGILPDDPKEASIIRRKAPRFYYNAISVHCIVDRMMESYFGACHTKKLMSHSKKLMMVCAELINLVQSSEIDSEDLGITG